MIKGFKMKLFPGQEAEYEKRHNELWPEMQRSEEHTSDTSHTNASRIPSSA